MRCGLVLAFVAAVTAQNSDVISDPEAYAVFRAVLPTLSSSTGKEPSHITLLQETRAGMQDCARDETIPAPWRPVVESYWKENARVQRIESGRDLGVAYSLVTWAELTRLMQAAGYDLSKFAGRQSPGSEVFSQFRGGRLVALSAVGFNAAKDRAMVTVQSNCFPSMQPGVDTAVCHSGGQVMLEKQADRWVRSKFGGCRWIA